jgi:type VI secretion system protein ImpF
MARIASQEGLKPSIIDRLIDPESDGTNWRRGYSIEQMVDAVRKDVEDLLNSHRASQEVPEELVEVRKSIVAYGLPDLVSYHSGGPGGARQIGEALEEAISLYEPRLSNVRAILIESTGIKSLKLDFEIQATLRVDPSPEVSFVTVLKLTTGEASIERTNG